MSDNSLPVAFGAVMTALGLYPSSHPAVVQQLNGAYVQMVKRLRERNTLLAVADDVLVVDGEPIYEENAAVRRVRDALVARGWEHVTFLPGLTRDELEHFLVALSGNAEGWTVQARMTAWMENRQIVHIEFSGITKGEAGADEGRAKARQVFENARNIVKGVMEESRLGKIPDSKPVYDAVHGLSDIILSQADAILGLTMLKSYDEYTYTHSVNVGALSIALARELGFQEPLLTDIGIAGLMHDVGKTRIPIEVLNKPSKLTDEEWQVMKQHPVHSYSIVHEMKDFSPYAVASVRQHHCRYDRTGYPALEPDEEFVPGAQIVAIADCYDGMTTQRQYQKCYDPKESLEVMVKKLAGTSLNPKYLQAFIRLLGIYPIGTLVRLDTGEIALVTERRTERPTEPMVKLLNDPLGRPYDEEKWVDLSSQEKGITPRAIVAEVSSFTHAVDLEQHLA